MLPAFITPLVAGGLNLLANAAMVKGKEWVEEKTGISLEKPELTREENTRLQQFEIDNEEDLLKLKVENNRINAKVEMAYLKDTQDARGMQKVAIGSEDQFVRRFVYYFAIYWSVAFTIFIGFVTFGNVPKDNVRFADTILGFFIGAAVGQIINFFYGSSKGSHDKNQLLIKN